MSIRLSGVLSIILGLILVVLPLENEGVRIYWCGRRNLNRHLSW